MLKCVRRGWAVVGLLWFSGSAQAFWLLGFSTADTTPVGGFSAIAGTGGQYSSVGAPRQSSFTPFLPHAGFRTGLAEDWDIGYRLTQVALPFSSVGPSLGSEVDVKHLLTDPSSSWKMALVVGMAYSYLEISGQSKNAWSPGVDLIASHALSDRYTLITELRYVYTAIPSAAGGSSANNLNATGVDIGTKVALTPSVALVPEIGLFDFRGSLMGYSANGLAFQYGAVLSFRF